MIPHKTARCIVLLLMVTALSCTLTLSPLEQGRHYLERGRYERAIRALQEAANEEGDIYYYAEAYSLLGQAYARSGQPEKALPVYRNARQILALKLREISARRMDIRRALTRPSVAGQPLLQEEDLRLADEEWKLKEIDTDIKERIAGLSLIP